ncbi:hypothetical protein DASC09_009330 [Saccharomycopsis crataegensis]|uniref:Uncharacterized protein n=1 Tax=Saccharomycopsis crataegensis TaxID=43959 RepID=A0AAV5QFU8_9ASCO|nr:hypothetical protein DASC09_009330 [Saccharomycopsis crataegensis]
MDSDDVPQITISPYSALLERRLFLSAPQMALPEVPQTIISQDDGPSARDLKCLKYLLASAVFNNIDNSDNSKTYYIAAASMAKRILLSTNLSPDDYASIYQLWESRLTSLVLSNEPQCVNIAKQESKKLSNHLFKLTHVLHGENRKIGFPANIPLSLELLIIRLRTNSPSTLSSSEIFSLLWILRENVAKNIDSKAMVDSSTVIIYLLSFNISANLIAKRDYPTFLTHSDSIIDNLKLKFETKKGNESGYASLKLVDQKLFSDYCLLASLVSLIQGNFSKSKSYTEELLAINKVETLSNLPSINVLVKVLMTIAPILDNDDLLNLKPLDKIPKIESWEDLVNLYKDTRITGRILCHFCGLIELNVRNDGDFIDIFRSGKRKNDLIVKFDTALGKDTVDEGDPKESVIEDVVKDDSIEHVDILINCWKMNIDKVYGME